MNYPKITIILRGCSMAGALKLGKVLTQYKDKFAIEVTLNTPDALNIISELNNQYDNQLLVGAGTVRTFEDANAAISKGAKFLLGPHTFTEDIFHLCKVNQVMAIPGAFSPSEIVQQFNLGASIVKIFPANAVGPKFFKDIQAPLGKLELMAVGGVGIDNYQEYFDNQTNYVGIGAGLFGGKSLEELDENEIIQFLERYV